MKTIYKYFILVLCTTSLMACNDDKDYTSGDPNAAPDAPKCYDVNDLYQSYNIFFKPAQGWVGDPMPYYENGKYHIFYLQDARDGAATFHPWYEVSTDNFSKYTDNGEMIACGTVNDQDGALGTGSVFKHNGTYYAFYTGHNGKLDPREKILLATSSDLKTWTKNTSFELSASHGYDRNEFRDPIIIKEGGKFKMLLSTRADYKGSWRAVIAQYSSTDLLNWALETPFYDDDKVFMIECPDVFTMGNYQYLIYSDINDRKVHYIYRQTGSSAWTTPSNTTLDGIAFYAGKTASDGTDRYISGWCPTRNEHSDYNDLGWAGSLVTHKLIQHNDGTLTTTFPHGLNDMLSNVQSLSVTSSENANIASNSYTLKSVDKQSNCIFDRQQGAYKITAKVKADTSTSFGFEFGSCGNRREVYALVFDLKNNNLKLERRVNGEVMGVDKVRLNTPVNKEFDVTIVVENSVCVVYVNHELSFTNRIYKMNQNPWGIFADNGEVIFSEMKLSK